MSREGFWILKERAVPCVRVHEQDRVGQIFGQPVRVAYRNHLVMETLYDQRGMRYAFQVGEALAREALPLAKGRYLRLGNVRPGWRVLVVRSLQESRDK